MADCAHLIVCAICALTLLPQLGVLGLPYQALPVPSWFYGVHTTQLAGPLTLANGTTKYAQAILYFKGLQRQHTCGTRPSSPPLQQPDGFDSNATHEFRAVMFLLDAGQQQMADLVFEGAPPQRHNHLLPALWQKELGHLPGVRLQPVKYHNRVDASNITIPREEPAVPSHMMEVLDQQSQQYSYLKGMLTAQGPLHYRGSLDAGALHGHYGEEWGLCVDGWWGCTRVPAALLTQRHPMMVAECSRRTGPTFWLLFKTMYAASQEAAARRLYAALTYHQQIGFHGAILYENGGYVDTLSSHPLLQEPVAHGNLRVMQWGPAGGTWVPSDNSQVSKHLAQGRREHCNYTRVRTTMLVDTQADMWPEFGVYDQEMQYTHAAMAMWGLNAYLLYTDVDEFLVLHPPAQQPPIGESVLDCFRGLLYLQLARVNYMCDSALGDPGASAPPSRPTRTNSTTAPPRALLHDPAAAAALSGSRSSAGRKPVADSRASKHDGNTAEAPDAPLRAQQRQALRAYMDCSWTSKDVWNDWPKVLAYADAVASMVVHEGLVWSQYSNATQAPVPSSCAHIVHIHNLAFERGHSAGQDLEQYVKDDTWLLPLREALAQNQGRQ